MVLQLGLVILCCINNASGVQIWAEYAQSLPVPGITATDAYQLKINGTQLLMSGAYLHLCMLQQPLELTPMCRRGYNWSF